MGPDVTPPQSAARNTALALASQLVTGLATAALTLFLVRRLGPSEFGLFSIALGVGAIVILPADLGISAAAARFIAERRHDQDSVVAILATALRLKLAAAVLAGVGLFLLAGPIAAAYHSPNLRGPLRGVAVAVAGQTIMVLYLRTFAALGRVGSSLRAVASESAVELGASVAFVALGWGATGAAFGRATGYLVGALMGVILAARMFGRAIRIRSPKIPQLGLSRYARAQFVVEGAYTLFSQIDLLLLQAFVSASAAGVFAAPMRLIVVLQYPGLAAASGVSPRMARGHQSPDTATFERTLRYLVLLAASFLAPVLVWAHPLVGLLLGSGYGASAGVLRALAPFMFLAVVGPVLTTAMSYLGAARRRVPIAIAAVVLNAAVDLALIPGMAGIGAAIGTDVAYALYFFGHLWICTQVVHLRMGALALTAIRALAAAAAAAVVLWCFGTQRLDPADWIAGGAAAGLIYALVLLVSREVTAAELNAAWVSFRRRGGRT
jgi:O-antigen/teichoic acid export membrane protein